MPNTDDKPVLKITLDDLKKVEAAQSSAALSVSAAAPGMRQYGNVSSAAAAEGPVVDEGKSNILLQGWFYLGTAGLLGALVGWGIAEPFFTDHNPTLWNRLLLPSVIAFMCLGFGTAESLVERTPIKALKRGWQSLLLGFVGGFILDIFADIFFSITTVIVFEFGVRTSRNPAFWIARGLAWMVFGVAGGIIYGAVDRSSKKMRYGILGGVIGAGLGGMIFDPIDMVTHHGAPSRAIGFVLFGLATGVAMGIVESALKDRWLYVASGPLAGKQFILYKPVTVIGSSQGSDIYLFKDNSIQPQHASIELRGAQTFLNAVGPVFVSGQPARRRSLDTGDLIQIGRYVFHFRERHKK